MNTRFKSRPKVSVVRLFLTLFLLFFAVTLAKAEYLYRVNGKNVPRNVYEAARLVQEASKLLQDNNLDLAYSKLKRALSYDPKMSIAHGNIGIILARRGKNEEALKHLKAAIQSPDCPPFAFLNLASFYQTTGNLEGSISTMKALIRKIGTASPILAQAEETLAMLEKEKRRREENPGKDGLETDYYEEIAAKKSMRWAPARMPLRVYVKSPARLDGYKPEYDGMLKQSFKDWEKASKKKVSFVFVDSKNDADIDCFWTDDEELLGSGSENGHTEMRSIGGAMNHASIALRSKEIEGSFPFTDNAIALTCRHEVGHALGLAGHSSNPDDLMYFSVPLSDSDKVISARDLNTLLKLYSKDINAGALLLDFLLSKNNMGKVGGLIVVLAVTLGLAPFVVAGKGKKKRKPKK